MNTWARRRASSVAELVAAEQILFRSSIRMRFTCPYNALPVDVASGSCPEVRFWDIGTDKRACIHEYVANQKRRADQARSRVPVRASATHAAS
jgi:hypothetical protein